MEHQENSDQPNSEIIKILRTEDPVQIENTKPRLGRRESEPHSKEVTYIYDVLTTNFPNNRAFWDLHHYFTTDSDEIIDVEFDISYFKNFSASELTSYKASMHGNRIPDLVINILSKSTWRKDLLEIVEICLELKIPYYITFAPYHIANKQFAPPFLRIHKLTDDRYYKEIDIRDVAVVDGVNTINSDLLFDLSPDFPFKIGLKKLSGKCDDKYERFRLVFITLDGKKEFLTYGDYQKAEKEKYEKILTDNNIII